MPVPTHSFTAEEKVEAGFLPRCLMGFVDVGLVMASVILLMRYENPAWLYQAVSAVNTTLLVLLALILYRLCCFLFLGGTLGMKLFRVSLLSGEQQPLSFPEQLLISFFILYRGAAYYK